MSRILFVLLLTGIGPHAWRQPGGEIKVLCSTAFKRVMEDLGPRFERTTGQQLAIEYGTSASLAQRIEKGQAIDLTVLTPDLIDRLIANGAIVAATRTSLARAPMALAIRSGAGKPDVATTAALKATLLAAGSIAYARNGAAGLYFADLLERLGIARTVGPKSVLTDTGLQVGESVATGRAELGVLPLSEIIGVTGLDVAGAFPHDVQGYAVMVSGIATVAANRRAAQNLIDFLASPEADPAIEHAGMERPPK